MFRLFLLKYPKTVLKGQKSLGRRCVGWGGDSQIYEGDKGVLGCQQGRDIPHICHGPMGQARVEKICHVEKFQISVHETCGES